MDWENVNADIRIHNNSIVFIYETQYLNKMRVCLELWGIKRCVRGGGINKDFTAKISNKYKLAKNATLFWSICRFFHTFVE